MQALRFPIIVGLIALAAYAPLVEWTEYDLWSLGAAINDQAAYVLNARNIAEHGRFTGNVIYTSTLAQDYPPGRTLYMPGYATVLAAFFWVFGSAAPAVAFLPSMLAYLTSVVCVYLLAVRFASPVAARLAACLFAFFPPNLLFAYLAMTE